MKVEGVNARKALFMYMYRVTHLVEPWVMLQLYFVKMETGISF